MIEIKIYTVFTIKNNNAAYHPNKKKKKKNMEQKNKVE